MGKTVFATLLVTYLRESGFSVAGFKPVCSGGRSDALAMYAALGGTVDLDEINPWHFRAAISPLLAARVEKRRVTLSQVVTRAEALQERFPVLIMEGAGGILSPLGVGFDSRDLIKALRAIPVVVAPNRLGVINHALLTLESLPGNISRRTQLVLVSQRKADSSARGNIEYLRQRLGPRVHELPQIKSPRQERRTAEMLASCVKAMGL